MSFEQPHLLVSCGCVLCHCWRRVGLLLVRPGLTESFRALAVRRCRELFAELLDASECIHESGGFPVAAGLAPRPLIEGGEAGIGAAPPGGSPGLAGSPAPVSAEGTGGAAVGPAQATSKAPPPAPGSASVLEKTTEVEAVATPREENKSETPVIEGEKTKKRKKDKSGKEKKPKRSKSKKPKSSRARTPVKKESEEEEPASSVISRVEGEERENSREKVREKKARPVSLPRESAARRAEREGRRGDRESSRTRQGRRRAGSRSRSRGRDRRREERETRSERREKPALSSGHQRPAEPTRPPAHWDAPRAPPPGQFYSTPGNYSYWRGYRPWPGQSKGVKRRQRAEDIRTYGADPDRKAERERWQNFG